MDAKTAVAKILKAEGVEHLLCFPNNALIEAAAVEGIRPICARTERVAVNIADGMSRVSSGRRIGVCAVQYGPGAENAFGGVAQAYSDGSPVLLLPGGVERRRQGVAPGFQAIYNYRAVTKWVEVVNAADRIPQMMRRAFTLLRCGRPGPVMLEVPTDVMKEEIPEEALRYVPVARAVPQGDPADVREAVRTLLEANAPVIVAGQGILYAEAWEELREFAELTQVPVLTTLNGKSAFPEDHPLALGPGGLSGTKMVDHFLRKADLVLGLGTSFTRSTFVVPIPPGKAMVQVTIDEQDLNKDYAIAHAVIGDAKAVLGQLIEEVRRQAGSNARREDTAAAREVKAVKEEFLKEWLPRLTAENIPISPYRVIWDLMHTADRRRTIVTHDSGNPRDQIVPFYEAIAPHGYIGWGKSTQLGSGLGLAMGAKLAAPDKLAVNVMGDTAFGMVGMDFETAVRARIPILTIVMNNGLMGGYEKYLPVSTARYGLRYLSGDYAKVAEGLGGYTERVEKPHELVPALRRAIEEVAGGRAALLEVITREEPVYPKYW
ncbi:MAG: thiamine pyrophosphate-requiring protein [Candidatus Rokubacteria bacterium]|nr:thiamine pyrophosphate-requiring protein [Candidatus Rokubacteria bacterium]